MSSRVLRGAERAEPEKIAWRRAGAPAVDSGWDHPHADDGGAVSAEAPGGGAQEERRLARIREAAFQEGLRQGRAEVEPEAAQRLQQAIQSMSAEAARSIEEFANVRLRMRQQMEADLVRLAVAVARRILRRELHVDPEALLGIVKAAVERIDSRELHRIRVSPADAGALERRLAGFRLPVRVEVAADPELAPGAVVLDTVRGRLDASVETQLEEIERGLADAAGRPA